MIIQFCPALAMNKFGSLKYDKNMSKYPCILIEINPNPKREKKKSQVTVVPLQKISGQGCGVLWVGVISFVLGTATVIILSFLLRTSLGLT